MPLDIGDAPSWLVLLGLAVVVLVLKGKGIIEAAYAPFGFLVRTVDVVAIMVIVGGFIGFVAFSRYL